MDATPPVSHDLSQYLGTLRRHAWILLLLTVGGVGAASVFIDQLPKTYESSTSVLVTPAGQDTNVTNGRTKGEVNLDTEAQVVRSTAVAVGATALLRSTRPPDELARNLAVDVPANTSVLVITYTADDPARAQAGSHAFAVAYLRNRQKTSETSTGTQITALSTKIKQLNATLTSVNNQLARADGDSPRRPNLESQRTTTQNQLNSLNSRLNELTTSTVSAGSIISDARLPSRPSSPNRMLNLATGAMIGLLVGLGLAVLRDRLDRRIRGTLDLHRAQVPVLAVLNARSMPKFDDVLQPYGPGGRIFNRLRNEVLANLGPHDQVVTVTGASRGPVTTLVAANLATALARTGNEVILIGAHLPDSMVDTAPLARIFGIAATPGLSEVLTGRVPLRDALQQAPRVPSLRVVTTGGTATAAGLMQSQGMRDTLNTLRRQARYVVIEAPSMASTADAQSLASLADAALLAVELHRSRRPEVADAVDQLQRVGTALLGAVVLPKVNRRDQDESARRPAQPPPPPRSKPVTRTYGSEVARAVMADPADSDLTAPISTISTTRPGSGAPGRPSNAGTLHVGGNHPGRDAGGGTDSGGQAGDARRVPIMDAEPTMALWLPDPDADDVGYAAGGSSRPRPSPGPTSGAGAGTRPGPTSSAGPTSGAGSRAGLGDDQAEEKTRLLDLSAISAAAAASDPSAPSARSVPTDHNATSDLGARRPAGAGPDPGEREGMPIQGGPHGNRVPGGSTAHRGGSRPDDRAATADRDGSGR